MTNIIDREFAPATARSLESQGIHPVLARVYAARGIRRKEDLDWALSGLDSPDGLKGLAESSAAMADAIEAGKRIVVVADYDADGATACAVAVRGLREMGADAGFLVPNRFTDGYGLTPAIVHRAIGEGAELLLTVDNGIASVEGVATARAAGVPVIVTDHHLPGDELPDTWIVNPRQPGCTHPGKNLAGVGVLFYFLIGLRSELRRRGWFARRPEPNLARHLDLVALGTVADLVKLDPLNRRLVANGLERIRSRAGCAGIRALFDTARRDPAVARSYDLAFAIAPRLNAAGRMEDMSLGIACLLADNDGEAQALAQRLDDLNRQRQEVEIQVQEEALAELAAGAADTYSLCVFRPDWHSGVIGIVASRLKERLHRPVLVFCLDEDGMAKGSGRSIAGFHLRDTIDAVAKKHPGLVARFGGHAMAAGLTLATADPAAFSAAFEAQARETMAASLLQKEILTDGLLPAEAIDMPLAGELRRGIWGEGFPEPRFRGHFRVDTQRVVGGGHRQITLAEGGRVLAGIAFRQPEPLPEQIDAVFAVDVNHWRGTDSVQLILHHWSEGRAA